MTVMPQPALAEHRPEGARTHDGLATAALICGIAAFVPLTPPFITPLAAVVLGLLSGRRRDGRRLGRSNRAKAGVVLGCVWWAAFAAFCVVYFWILGYPLPHLHHYHAGG